MEKKKAVKMLIARYTSDAAALGKRERDLIKQMEAIENLIPNVTIAYVSKVTQSSSDMSLPRSHVEEAKERLEHLKRSLKEVQQSIEMVREEERVMNQRIKELETSLCELDEYLPTTNNNVDNDYDVQSFHSPDEVQDEEKVDPKIDGVKHQSGKRFSPAKDTDSKQYRGRNIATDAQHMPKPGKTNASDVGTLNLDRKIGKLNMLETNIVQGKPTTKPGTSLERSPDTNIVKAKRMPKPVKSVFRMAPDSRIAPYLRNEKYEIEIENYKLEGFEDNKRVKLTQGAHLENDSEKKIGRAPISTRDKPEILRKSSQGEHLKDLLHGKDTDWKQVYDNLSYKVDKLNEHLESSTKKLQESESYVKNLEEECSKLEKELRRKIQLMSLSTFEMVEGEGITPAYMQLAHWRFALKLSEYQGDRELKEKLFNGIKQGNMAPYYKEVCADLGWKFDSKLYDEMSAANVKRLEELEKEHENNVMDEEDQSQLCGVWQSKLDYLCSIGDRENATTLANSKVDDKTVPKSHRIDAVFSLFRISFFHGCNVKGMSTAIEKATELIEGISGGDWSARNKLKAYEGVWSLAIRDFTRAAHLFVDVVPTFESYELADFGTIIRYTVLSCMIALPRCDLRKKLMLHGVMAQALHSQYQDLREYFVSLYDGRYSDFLVCLARIEVEMKRDPLLHPHYRHYVQEMRLRAYKQILQAYRSLSLDYMAQSFGVTSEFIEREVARFAAAGRLQCKIDSVAGTVITSAHLDDSVRSKEAPEASQDRNILYQTTVKRGDILLNRLKKLARVMDF